MWHARPDLLFFDLVSEPTKRVCNGFGSRLLDGGYYGMVTFDHVPAEPRARGQDHDRVGDDGGLVWHNFTLAMQQAGLSLPVQV